MEPFGILNFLKTLLPAMDFSANSTPNGMENQENFSTSTTTENAKTPTQEQTKNAPPAEDFSAKQNAFTQFMENHDARVKRTKKD